MSCVIGDFWEGILVILYYAFDREMLNAAGYLQSNRKDRKMVESIIEKELKELIFIMPLSERIVISPSFRFESLICRKVIERNRSFTENGIIAEYRREADPRDFWLKKNDSYSKAMSIFPDYRDAYGNESQYKKISSLWIERIPKQKPIGVISRNSFMENVIARGDRLGIPKQQTQDIVKITDETREDTFLWEMEELALHQYDIGDKIIRQLGVRELMNESYLDVFAEQGIHIYKSRLIGISQYETKKFEYDSWFIDALLNRLGISKLIEESSADTIVNIRKSPEVQDVLDVIRDKMEKQYDIQEICTSINQKKLLSLISKLIIQPIGGDKIMDSEIVKKDTIKILHLSDLHLTDQKAMQKHYNYLKLDLAKKFKVERIDYLVISGDVCDRPEKEMYEVACEFVQKLEEDFKVPKSHIILTPGNHDCNWNISRDAYSGDRIVDQDKYNARFSGFSDYFFWPITGKQYPLIPEEQHDDNIFPEDGLCILGLNSCWKIDHSNTANSSICTDALIKSEILWCDESKYVKLAVWHHPLMGEEAIHETTFMDTLSITGFRAFIHGHIHEAKNDLFTYDDKNKMTAIGAGTFGAVKNDRGDGIPRQYNLIEYDKNERILKVHTRKREKEDGVWQADARWGDKGKSPKPYYTIKC